MKKLLSILIMLVMLAAAFTGCGDGSASQAAESDSLDAQIQEDPSGGSESTEAESSEAKSARAEYSEPGREAQGDGMPGENAPPQEELTILMAAAASLEDSFVSRLIPLFNEQYPQITVEASYDSSGKLQTQIEEGLGADLFFSAATKQMEALTQSGFIDESTVVPLLENEIVLIAPADADTNTDHFQQIGEGDGIIAIGDPQSVPAGQYAQEALESLGVWDAIQDRLSLGTNVTEVLNQVAEGSAELGIVYATDAAQMPERVKVLAAAPEGSLQQKVLYPVGILSDANHPEAAALFLSFLKSPQALAVFRENGFKPAE